MAGEFTMHITGLKEYRAALRDIDRGLGPELRIALNKVAGIVADAAKLLVPKRSGNAADSIKPGSTQTAAQLKVGGTKAPYYPWLDFGGAVGRNNSVRRPFFKAGRYIYPTAKEKQPEMIAAVELMVGGLTQKAGF